MLQNIKARRGGFTLVEIMIVVAIIALLASIAVPNFMRARQRAQATACKQDAAMVESARDQWAIETNAKPDATVTFDNLKPYIKENSPLYSGGGNDTVGNAITFTPLKDPVKLSSATKDGFTSVEATFWSPF